MRTARWMTGLALLMTHGLAHAGETWLDPERDGSIPTEQIVKKAGKKPDERANDALLMLAWRGSLCTDRKSTNELLRMGADPNAGLVENHPIPQWGEFSYDTTQPLFWHAIEFCPTGDLAQQLMVAGADPTEGWAEIDVRVPDQQDEILLGERRRQAIWSWLTRLLTQDVPAASAQMAAKTYDEIAERGSTAEQQRAKDNLTYGDRPALEMWVRHCAGDAPTKGCTGEASQEIFRALVRTHAQLQADAGEVAAGAMPWLVKKSRFDLAEILAEEGVDLSVPIGPGLSADGKEIHPAPWQGLTIAEYLVLQADEAQRDAFMVFAEVHGIPISPVGELQARVAEHLGRVQAAVPMDAAAVAGQRKRVVDACVARGQDAAACAAAREVPPLDTSILSGLYRPERVRELELMTYRATAMGLDGVRGDSDALPTLEPGAEKWFSLATLETGPSDPVVASQSAPCGVFFGSAAPPATAAGCEGESCARYGQLVERFYEKYPQCARR